MWDFLMNIITLLIKGFLGLLAFCLVLAIPVSIYEYVRFKRLAKKREGLSICEFARSFDCRRVDTKIIRAAYEGFQNWAGFGIKDFPVMASDDVYKIYGMESEDLEDFGGELAEKVGRSWNALESNPLYGKVNTVRDLVLFLDHQPKVIS